MLMGLSVPLLLLSTALRKCDQMQELLPRGRIFAQDSVRRLPGSLLFFLPREKAKTSPKTDACAEGGLFHSCRGEVAKKRFRELHACELIPILTPRSSRPIRLQVRDTRSQRNLFGAQVAFRWDPVTVWKNRVSCFVRAKHWPSLLLLLFFASHPSASPLISLTGTRLPASLSSSSQEQLPSALSSLPPFFHIRTEGKQRSAPQTLQPLHFLQNFCVCASSVVSEGGGCCVAQAGYLAIAR